MSRPISADAPPTAETGTIGYAAPEQLRDDVPHTTGTDVFAFGLILYEIISGQPVFDPSQPQMAFVRQLRFRQFPEIPEDFGRLMQNLIPRCWASEPRRRPSFQDIFNEFRTADYRILPSVDRAHLKHSMDQVLDWEARMRIGKRESLS
jgi:serine/threonine protein kinase